MATRSWQDGKTTGKKAPKHKKGKGKAFSNYEVKAGFLTGNMGGKDSKENHALATVYMDMLHDDLKKGFPGAKVRVVSENGEGAIPANLQPSVSYIDPEIETGTENLELTDDIAYFQGLERQIKDIMEATFAKLPAKMDERRRKNKAHLTIKKDRETGEWLVIWWDGAKRNEDSTSYQDSKEDAEATMKEMQKEVDAYNATMGY